MNILRRHAPLFNITQRALDVVILLAITSLLSKRYGPPELMRVLAIYGGLLLVVIFSLFNIYKSWRIAFISSQIKTLFFAWGSFLVVFNILILLLSNKEQMAILFECFSELRLSHSSQEATYLNCSKRTYIH